MAFTSIPILDLSLALSPSTKPDFLIELRHALLEVGFLYIKNVGLPNEKELYEEVKREAIGFFDIPMEEKLRIEMKNEKSFLGYSRLGGEITKHATDHREQIDLSTPHAIPRPSSPLYHNLLAPTQWPSSTYLPKFRPTIENYMKHMGEMSMRFTSLLAEAIGLPPDAFEGFYDTNQQHKLKIVKYPDMAALGFDGDDNKEQRLGEGRTQGVGPHKDSMLTSYLLQASHHAGLQVQNHLGQWISCPPIDDTLVVAIGQGMEALTNGVCKSTTHRVLSPAPGTGARYSVPFFQGVSYDATFESMAVPASVLESKRKLDEREGGRKDDIEFTFVAGRWGHLGEATLMNRIKSHPDVSEIWYPEELKQIRAQQAEEAKQAAEAEAAARRSEKEDAETIPIAGVAGLSVQESGSAKAVEAH